MEFTMPTSLLQDFHFLRPLWLLALLPALVFFIALWRMNSSLSAWDRAIDKDLLPYLLETSKSAAQRTPLYLLLAAWILSTVALAGPVWEELPQPVQQREDALVIVMDLSLSMVAADHEPSRLDLAKRRSDTAKVCTSCTGNISKTLGDISNLLSLEAKRLQTFCCFNQLITCKGGHCAKGLQLTDNRFRLI